MNVILFIRDSDGKEYTVAGIVSDKATRSEEGKRVWKDISEMKDPMVVMFKALVD